ncbi:hypothetical protein FHX37_0075 [Haloactinospora alba]|uniref:Uncharacterized protein n=1 Tax=Haloactinospora alba TaxID=405555 RepID=A0A543NEE4_9ACTN|nr:hypothetical protein [Haloactinospora alba]TQN30214.1 hypothetical protein FHX37_0075 [Haloactinospora alba]
MSDYHAQYREARMKADRLSTAAADNPYEPSEAAAIAATAQAQATLALAAAEET